MSARKEGTTYGFPKILEHLANPANKATNAIIITDNDVERMTYWQNCTPVELQGCVWFLWKNGSTSRRAPKYLKGRRGTYQYNLPIR